MCLILSDSVLYWKNPNKNSVKKVTNMTKKVGVTMRNAPPHTPLYVLAYVAVRHYILLGCLARVARKLPNWSGFPPYLLLFSPVLRSRNSVIVLNCHAYFPFSGFNGVSSALMINNKNS